MNRDEQRRVAQRMVDLQLQREVWEAWDREYAKAGSDHLSDEVRRGLDRLQDRLFEERAAIEEPIREAARAASPEDSLGLDINNLILLFEAEFLRQFDGEPARMGDLMLAQSEPYLLERFWLDVDSTFYRSGSRDGPRRLRYNGEPVWVPDLAIGRFEDAETMAADWYDAWADKLQKVVDMPAWRRQDRQVQQNLVGFIRLMRDRAELFRNGPDPVTQRFFEAPDPDNSRPPASSSGGGGGGPATIAFALVATPPTVRVKRRAWFRSSG